MNYNLTYDDLENRLKDEVNLLIDLCYQFDEGKYEYANVIATKIGSIINFSNRDSILPNMKKQTEVPFWSTSKVITPTDNVLFYRSLVDTKFDGKEVSYYPKFDFGNYLPAWVNFNTWAYSPVFIFNASPENEQFNGLIYLQELNENTQFKLNRKDIINFYRNKLGGAHQDAKLESRMYYISNGISSLENMDNPKTKFTLGAKYHPGKPFKYLFEMSIRQIAHELIITIKHSFDLDIKYKPDYHKYVSKRPKNLLDHKVILISGKDNNQIKVDNI